MSEVAAQQKFTCPGCGAEARWDPARQALACPYCGTIAPGELSDDGTTIREIDLVTALRNAGSEARGWQRERLSVKCQSCQASIRSI
jgi:ribosomal protein S27E